MFAAALAVEASRRGATLFVGFGSIEELGRAPQILRATVAHAWVRLGA